MHIKFSAPLAKLQLHRYSDEWTSCSATGLEITGDYPYTRLAQILFAQTGLLYLISDLKPKRINTNFSVLWPISMLMESVYELDKVSHKPFFSWSETAYHDHGEDYNNARKNKSFSNGVATSSERVIVAYSGGRDSLWNMMWAQEKYGVDNVMAVHISGLNGDRAQEEKKYILKQFSKLGFKHFRIVNLSGANEIYMSAGDYSNYFYYLFIAGILTPIALEFGAGRIITEGYLVPDVMKAFNTILQLADIPVKVCWRDISDMGVTKELIKKKPEWLPYVCGCFASGGVKKKLRRAWKKRAPTFPFYKSECGSCYKCKILSLARILYDPALKETRREDIVDFLENTVKWAYLNEINYQTIKDDLAIVCKKYGVKFFKTKFEPLLQLFEE